MTSRYYAAMNPIPEDYSDRVYAGVLGKLIGVYLGRPFEGWSYEAISARWGEINCYVHEDQKVPLIVSDDDISGTFTFIRALLDHDSGREISSREIGQTWLNYMAEHKHILSWSGMGRSTEHTAYLRLAAGIEAPESGSIALNGKAVAEEIGAQIFIDGWAMVSPKQPEQAARFAREASLVSHDGEAVHGAVMIAVMESLAFGENDIDLLIDGGLKFIPADSEISRMIADLRRWHREDGDWRVTLNKLRGQWGYERYGTGCPMVSNHAIIILALLYGQGDFDRSMMIVNTSGYDTDCNAGNLGCLLGIRNGLGTFRTGYDWRTPVNDRMVLPSADGHWGMMDAAGMAQILVNIGRKLAGQSPVHPKGGARYNFVLPGSTHGFAPTELCPRATKLEPVDGGLRLRMLVDGLRCDAEVATFLTPDMLNYEEAYWLSSNPALYPGQTLCARVLAAESNAAPMQVRLMVRTYKDGETLELYDSPDWTLAPGEAKNIEWMIPENVPMPVATAGLSVAGPEGSAMVLDSMTWHGVPSLNLTAPPQTGVWWRKMPVWARSFTSLVDHYYGGNTVSFSLMQNRGRGLLHTGSGEWEDYCVSAGINPMLAKEFGIAARVQGLTRYYALLLRAGGKAVLVRMKHQETVLAETDFAWEFRKVVVFRMEVKGIRIRGWIDGREIFDVNDPVDGLTRGGIGFVITEGGIKAQCLSLTP